MYSSGRCHDVQTTHTHTHVHTWQWTLPPVSQYHNPQQHDLLHHPNNRTCDRWQDTCPVTGLMSGDGTRVLWRDSCPVTGLVSCDTRPKMSYHCHILQPTRSVSTSIFWKRIILELILVKIVKVFSKTSLLIMTFHNEFISLNYHPGFHYNISENWMLLLQINPFWNNVFVITFTTDNSFLLFEKIFISTPFKHWEDKHNQSTALLWFKVSTV